MANGEHGRCLYEILGLNPDCSPNQIRSTYRRLALQLHPDKLAAANAGGVTPEDTAVFQELNHAYEVLSDPLSRAGYNGQFKEEQLFSSPNPYAKPYKPDVVHPDYYTLFVFFNVDLRSYFTDSAFSGFYNYGRGFYKVYGDLFDKLHAQELWFTRYFGLDFRDEEEEAEDGRKYTPLSPAPLIGDLESPYSEVTDFYSHWLSFSTVLDFKWVNEFCFEKYPECNSGLMEEMNLKLRKKVENEFNDLVRGLADFMMKRDERLINMKKKKIVPKYMGRIKNKKKHDRRKKELVQAMGLADEQEDANEKSGQRVTMPKEETEDWYCVVCNKEFMLEMQLEKHNKSKKHKDKIAGLVTSLEIKGEW